MMPYGQVVDNMLARYGQIQTLSDLKRKRAQDTERHSAHMDQSQSQAGYMRSLMQQMERRTSREQAEALHQTTTDNLGAIYMQLRQLDDEAYAADPQWQQAFPGMSREQALARTQSTLMGWRGALAQDTAPKPTRGMHNVGGVALWEDDASVAFDARRPAPPLVTREGDIGRNPETLEEVFRNPPAAPDDQPPYPQAAYDAGMRALSGMGDEATAGDVRTWYAQNIDMLRRADPATQGQRLFEDLLRGIGRPDIWVEIFGDGLLGDGPVPTARSAAAPGTMGSRGDDGPASPAAAAPATLSEPGPGPAGQPMVFDVKLSDGTVVPAARFNQFMLDNGYTQKEALDALNLALQQ